MSEFIIKKDHWTLIVVFVGILLFAGIVSVAGPFVDNIGAADTTNSGEGGTGGSGTEAGANVVPTETETETVTPTQETGVKLLKKLGPFTFPEYGEKVENNEYKLVTQKTTFRIEDSDGGAGLNSLRDPGMWIKFPPSEKTIIMLMVYKDANGDPVSVSKIDEKTGSLYFAKTTYQPGSRTTTDKVACDETYLKEFPKTWEVLVYSY